MDDLVQRLSVGDHHVIVGGSSPSIADFSKRITDSGYVFIKFTDTQGGTDLGMRIDKSATDVSQASFENQEGIVHIEGELSLNYVKVRCVADIDLKVLGGTGHLVIIEKVNS